MSKHSKKPVLTQNEIDANKRVFTVYNLTREDFSTEVEFNDFLEERENLIYDFVHNNNTKDQAKATLKAFEKSHYQLIEKRKAQRYDPARNSQHIDTLPLLAQFKYQSKARQLNLGVQAISQYSNEKFMNEIQNREKEWKADQDISIGTAGGLPDYFYYDKCKQELYDSLFI